MSFLDKLETLEGAARKSFLIFMEFLAFTISLISLIVIWNTFTEVNPPMSLAEPDVVVSKALPSDDEAKEIKLTRILVANKPYDAKITGEIHMRDTNLRMQLQEANISVKEPGNVRVDRLYFVSHIPNGNWCMETTISWRPFLSLVDHSITTSPSCFWVQ